MLDERSRTLLKTLIERYIADGQPVGSRALSKLSGLDLSAATVRNVMADLEDLGFIASPHTSAGRVPTPRGYRFFVDSLLTVQPLDLEKVHAIEGRLPPSQPQQLISNASHLLSGLTHFAGIVLTPRRKTPRIRHMEFVSLSEKRILLILVSTDGDVQNRILFTERAYTPAELVTATNTLNEYFAGHELGQIRRRVRDDLARLRGDLQDLMEAALSASDEALNHDSERYIISGERNLLEVEELSSNMKRLRELFDLFEQRTALVQLLDVSHRADGIQLFIGGESGLAPLDECSVVTAPYEVDGQVVGSLGVIGPTRMAYERVIPIVDITAKLLSSALTYRADSLMPRYLPEPAVAPGTAAKTAVLLINLGTPSAPDAPAVRRYLREFLADPRVVEIPRALWWLILNGVILNVRPRQSARKYAAIWTDEGSPLKVHSERQTKLLRGLLGEDGLHVKVDYAMRYGQPSIPATLSRLKAQGCTRILLLPLYPQYAASTTASAFDSAFAWAANIRNQPELRTLRSFADAPAYIEALASSVREHWARTPRPQPGAYRLLMSFHGLPHYTLERGDPYHSDCRQTAHLLAEALRLREDEYLVTFQSRLGRARWLQPYTAPTLAALGRQGIERVDVICPGFVADCLETLEEIALEGKSEFIAAGGRTFNYIPCLNERDDWIRALADLAVAHLQGWPLSHAAAHG